MVVVTAKRWGMLRSRTLAAGAEGHGINHRDRTGTEYDVTK